MAKAKTLPKVPTMKISGKDYAQVKDRVKAFREIQKSASIVTSYEIMDSNVAFRAEIIIEGNVIATGHSFGKVSGTKEFEKSESIAVGRALAFSGYSPDGEIASYDEINEFQASEILGRETDIDAIKKGLDDVEDRDHLEEYFQSLSQEIRGLTVVEDLFKSKAKKLNK